MKLNEEVIVQLASGDRKIAHVKRHAGNLMGVDLYWAVIEGQEEIISEQQVVVSPLVKPHWSLTHG